MSVGVYSPGGINNNTGSALSAGNSSSTLINSRAPNYVAHTPIAPTGYSYGTFGTSGDINYQNPDQFVHLGYSINLNGLAAADVHLWDNKSTPEDTTYKYARALKVSSIDIEGNVTYASGDGEVYGLYPTSGTPVDKAADAQTDPYNTPGRLVSLQGLAPVVSNYSLRTSM